MSKERREILNVIAILSKNESTTRNLLSKMLAEGTVGMDGDGNYHVPSIDSVVTVVNARPLSMTPTLTTSYLPYADDSDPDEVDL